MDRYNRRQGIVEGVSEERIRILFGLAEEFCEKEPGLSRKYIGLALRISSRNKARIPADLRMHYCKKCNCFLNEKNSSLAKGGSIAALKCKECGFERKMKDCSQ